MSGPSKVIVLDPDPRAGRQVQLGFDRERIPAAVVPLPADLSQLAFDGDVELALVGGSDRQALDLVRRTRELLAASGADVPIVFTGRGADRAALLAAGADEVVARPVYLRDIVTITRILRGVPQDQRDHVVGSLVETTGVYTLVRALSALGRSAVLTLVRGLRRGEIRFYRGEVTSAQVGLIHGQAALHQLLLWTDARFDFAHEDIVRRQQIPLSPDELFADAERFLEGVRESSGSLSPATVLEPDLQRIQDLGKQIPTEVHGVLRMFDGHRMLADILEDSPYRVFETLRVAQKAVEVGLLRRVDSQRPKATWKAVLAIEEWLVGTDTREAVVERTAAIDSGPAPAPKGKGKRKRRNSKRQRTVPAAATPPPKLGIDWGALVPRVIGAEVGPLSPIVPAQEVHGEVELPSREQPREGLEALMDTAKRDRIFPTDIGLEPKVVIDTSEPARRENDTDVVELAPSGIATADAAVPVSVTTAVAESPASSSGFDVTPVAPKVDLESTASAARVDATSQPELAPLAAAPVAEPASALLATALAPATTDPAAALLAAPLAPATTDPASALIATPVETRPADPVSALIATPVTATPVDAASAMIASPISTKATDDDSALIAAPPAATSSQVVIDAGHATSAALAPGAVAPGAVASDAVASEAVASGAVPKPVPHATDADVLAPGTDAADAPVEPSSGHAAVVSASAVPEHDGPPLKETTGEIRERRTDDTREPQLSEPSILVADLAAVHAAASAAATKPAGASVDAASESRELEVSDVRRDAVSFSEAEEAFFSRAESHTASVPKLESFDDLDEDYEPTKFWDRVFGRNKKK